MANKKTKKKGIREQLKEREAARQKKKEELIAHYPEARKSWDELMELRRQSGLRDLVFEQFESLESYVEQRLEEWDNQQPPIISGRYFDTRQITATYQQKFVQYIQKLCPEVIEELRALAPYFKDLFGDNEWQYNSIFETHKMELFHLDNSLNSDVNSLLPLFPIIEFRPLRYKSFKYDFRWGEYSFLCHLLYLLFIEADKEKKEEVLQNAINILQKNLVIDRNYPGFPKELDDSELQLYLSKESERIVNAIISNGGDNFSYGVKEKLSSFLEIKRDVVEEIDEQKIHAFIILQVELVRWAERYNLEKDWVIKYGYEFLRQFSNNPNLKSSEKQVGRLMDFSLVADEFVFKFNGWLPGSEDLEVYADRLRENFESELEKYFRIAGSTLDLEKKKRVTKPIDFDRVKWLVRWTVQGWNKEQILQELDREPANEKKGKFYDISSIEKAFKQFQDYDLPIRA